jgi:hypothetical protein
MSGSGRIVAVDNMDRLGRFRADTHERLTQLRFPIGSGWASLLKRGRSHERREIGPIDRPTAPGCHAPRGNGCSSDDDLRPNCLHRPSQAVEAQNNGPIDFSGTLVTQCQTDRKGPALADRWRSGRGCGSGRRTAANLSYQGATGQSAAIRRSGTSSKASAISLPPCLLRLLPAGANRRVGLAPTGKRPLFTAHAESGRSACHGSTESNPKADFL